MRKSRQKSWSKPLLLAWRTAMLLACLAAASATPARATTAPFILTVYCSGGWDQSMVFDPKIGNGLTSQESGAALATLSNGLSYADNATRPNTKAFFTEFGDAAAIVNGLYVGDLDHGSAARTLFGTTPAGQQRAVDWLTYYAQATAPALDLPHVDFGAPFLPGSYEANASLVTSSTLADYVASSGTSVFGTDGEAALTALRAQAFAAFGQVAPSGTLDGEKSATLAATYGKEALLVTDLQKASKTIGTVAGDDTFTHQGRLAIELFAQGSTQAATIQAGAADLWDTTTANTTRQTANFEMLFAGLSKILGYARTRGVDGQLVVVVMSEMGRQPLLNSAGGKGPWPYTSMLLWGQGIKGGVVAGKTDTSLRGVAIDPIFGGTTSPTVTLLTPGNVWAAVYLSAGVDLKPILPSTPPLALIIAPGA